ncbi:MAG: exosortase A [Burkholderiaceae bacterium]
MTSTRIESSNLLKGCAIAAVLLAPFIIYFATARSIVDIWNSSETFAHGYIIFPISLWLIWKRRQTLALMSPSPFLPGLFFIAICGFGWLLAELGDVQVVRQYAFVAMIVLTVITILGVRISRSMAFPLCFLLLAVPFGDVFIEPLINFTADFTVWALQTTGIPVLRNGSTFEIPTGSWSVVQACSGVRYLISSVTLGCLYAYLTYRSRIRQAMFILLSIIVPIVANGMRAYMIVMIGHLSGMQLAVGVDHLIYGWLFFGIVMFLMFWIGSYWREDQLNVPIETIEIPQGMVGSATTTTAIFSAAVATIICLAIWPVYANYAERAGFNPVAADLSSFKAQWNEAKPFTDWHLDFLPANAAYHRVYQRDQEAVGLSFMYYRNQRHGAGLISSSNRLVPDNDASIWRKAGSNIRQEDLSNRTVVIRESRLQGGAQHLLVWQWYWIEGKFTVNDYVGKLMQARQKLMMRGDDGAAIVVYAPYTGNPEEARIAMRNFLNGNLTSVEATLAGNKKQ